MILQASKQGLKLTKRKDSDMNTYIIYFSDGKYVKTFADTMTEAVRDACSVNKHEALSATKTV